MMSERQIKGIIAVSMILAFIPFIVFLYAQIDSKCPDLSTSSSDALIIEVVEENGVSGVFFVAPGTSISQLFSRFDFRRACKEDFKLQNAMKIRFVTEGDYQDIIIEKMEAAKRLALGLPLDINLANHDELLLIPGVGEVMAANILIWRDRIGRYEKLDQLMDIKGIKRKKLSKLSKYLYIDFSAK